MLVKRASQVWCVLKDLPLRAEEIAASRLPDWGAPKQYSATTDEIARSTIPVQGAVREMLSCMKKLVV